MYEILSVESILTTINIVYFVDIFHTEMKYIIRDIKVDTLAELMNVA